MTEYRFVIAFHAGRAAIGESLGEALGGLSPASRRTSATGSGPNPSPARRAPNRRPRPRPAARPTPTAADLLADASVLLDEADAALREGDLGEYQAKVDEAGALIDQALDLLGATGATGPAAEPQRLTLPIWAGFVSPADLGGNRSTCRDRSRPDRGRVSPEQAQPGRRSCSARRARSSRKAIW